MGGAVGWRMLIGEHVMTFHLIFRGFTSFGYFVKWSKNGDVGSSEGFADEEIQQNFESVARNGRVCGRKSQQAAGAKCRTRAEMDS